MHIGHRHRVTLDPDPDPDPVPETVSDAVAGSVPAAGSVADADLV
jgi:hypothetical protein